MSKPQLKKVLQSLTKQQLEELIVDAYDFSKEFKHYFEYFLNPDVDKLLEDYSEKIVKELQRTKRGGYSKARVSVIRKLLKEFAAHRPGYDKELELMIYTIRLAVAMGRYCDFPNPMESGLGNIVEQTVELADRNFVADSILQRLMAIFTNEKNGASHLRKYLLRRLNEYNLL